MLEWTRRVNVNSLRFISLSLLFLSLTPLASIYVVISSAWNYDTTTEAEDDAPTAVLGFGNGGGGGGGGGDNHFDAANSNLQEKMEVINLLTVLRNPNATLEEILMVVLMQRAHQHSFGGGTTGGGGGGGGGSGSDVRTTMTMAYHWAAVIPWMLSVLFGFVIPIFLYIMSCIRSRRLQQMRESDYAAYRIRRRRDRLKSYFVNVTKTLTVDDRVTTTLGDGQKLTVPNWIVPRPGGGNVAGHNLVKRTGSIFSSWKRSNTSEGQSSYTGSNVRTVAGSCAICLDNYEIGEAVAWSSNPKCSHAFHSECLLDWFSTRRRKQYFCPCCRQNYFEKRNCHDTKAYL